jgi:predicted DNA-binding transcriptional regulator AlpA
MKPAALLDAVRALESDPDPKWSLVARAIVAVLRQPEPDEALGSKATAKLVGMSVATIDRRVNDGTFPAPLYIGPRKVWRRSIVEAWLEEQARKPHPSRRQGVATWTPEQHAQREARTRERKRAAAAAASRGGHA